MPINFVGFGFFAAFNHSFRSWSWLLVGAQICYFRRWRRWWWRRTVYQMGHAGYCSHMYISGELHSLIWSSFSIILYYFPDLIIYNNFCCRWLYEAFGFFSELYWHSFGNSSSHYLFDTILRCYFYHVARCSVSSFSWWDYFGQQGSQSSLNMHDIKMSFLVILFSSFFLKY